MVAYASEDDLSDLGLLLDHVKDTEVLVILQSKSVLTRPWVILELYTAIINDVPIVALNVNNSYPYDYSGAMHFLTWFDQEIEIANPGAAELLIKMSVDPVDVAYTGCRLGCPTSLAPTSTQMEATGNFKRRWRIS